MSAMGPSAPSIRTICEGRGFDKKTPLQKYILGNCLHCLAAGKAGILCGACKTQPHKVIQVTGVCIDPRKLASMFDRPILHVASPICNIVYYYQGTETLSQEYEIVPMTGKDWGALMQVHTEQGTGPGEIPRSTSEGE